MRIHRTKNATRNVVWGVCLKLVGILFPFIVRTTMIYIMGTEYVGLNNLFTSLLSFLSLAELGVGTALVYSMYKPIAEDDDDAICALLNLYKKLYRYIGIGITALGLLLVPFLHKLINSDIPDGINIYILYIIYLFNTVFSYLFLGYKQSLLIAFQRSDVISKRSLVFQTLLYIIQIISLFVFRNYYCYIVWLPISTVATNLANAYIVNKMFPQYKCKGSVPISITNSIKKKVLALFGTKANSIVLHAADNLVISAFLGLKMVGQYGNYYYIMNSIIGIMTVIYSSLTAGLGNSLEMESVEKNYDNFKLLTFMNAWLVGWLSICLLCIYQPFMKMWVGEELMFGKDIVLLLCIYFYIYQIRRIVLTFKDAAGIWWQDLLRPYVVMLTNIFLNIVLVQIIGIQGVIISTIVSMIISIPWENYTVFKYVFNRSSLEFYISSIKYLGCTVIAAVITYYGCYKVAVYQNNLINLLICVCFAGILPNFIYIILFCKDSLFRESIRRVKLSFFN